MRVNAKRTLRIRTFAQRSNLDVSRHSYPLKSGLNELYGQT